MNQSASSRAESVRQRLQNRLRERGEDVQFWLQRYAVERFLYRLGVSQHRERFVLKGAALFALWGGSLYRATRDIDFTGYGAFDEASVVKAISEVCSLPIEDEALTFDPTTLATEEIRDGSDYRGLRVTFLARLARARVSVQIDIGFGDAIEPGPTDSEYPSLLDDPRPHIRTYPPEAVVAEKLHAMVVLGERNSRNKDFYDLFVIAQTISFDGQSLTRSIVATFKRRQTEIAQGLPVALTAGYYIDPARTAAWRAYVSSRELHGAPSEFAEVGDLLQSFLEPVWVVLSTNGAFTSQWPARGPWR